MRSLRGVSGPSFNMLEVRLAVTICLAHVILKRLNAFLTHFVPLAIPVERSSVAYKNDVRLN